MLSISIKIFQYKAKRDARCLIFGNYPNISKFIQSLSRYVKYKTVKSGLGVVSGGARRRRSHSGRGGPRSH